MMTTDQIAKAAANAAVAMALEENYEVLPSRRPFFVSDRMDLEEAIANWLDNHMQERRG